VSLVVLAAGKGAPGVTTAAVALAAVWPRPAVLVEADPAGGDLVYRLPGADGQPLGQDRGLLSLAAAARSGPAAARLDGHLQRVAGGLDVLVGPAGPTQAAGMAPGWPAVAATLAAHPGADLVVDAGRLGPESPLPVLARADLVLLLVRPTVAGVAHLRAALGWLVPRLEAHPLAVDRLGVLVRTEPPKAAAAGREVAAVLATAGCAVPVLGAVAEDPAGAAGLAGQWTRALDRTALVTSARALAAVLDRRLAAEREPGPAPVRRPTPTSRSLADAAGHAAPAPVGGR
jgi:hypothetical protein